MPALRRIPLLLFPLLLLAGCGDAPDTDDISPAAEVAPSPEREARGEMFQTSMALRPVEGSGVTGEVMALHDADLVTLVVELEGLPAEGEYRIRVGQGTCATGGPEIMELNPVLGVADGTGISTTTLEADALPTDEAQFIEVLGEG
ncbi:MAG: hypothetical protein EA422_16060, partial [Gemmatimonadales bacterium]